MIKNKRKPRERASDVFRKELWTESSKAFIDHIYNHLKEFQAFSPAYFQEINFHLLVGKPTYYHTENLCEVVKELNLCKKCARRNTDDCTLQVRVNKERSSAALSILQMTDSLHLFNDGFHPYAWLSLGGYRKIVSLSSALFTQWVSLELYRAEGKPPSGDAINAAKNVLIARAFLESLTHDLYNRVAWYDEALYFDLSDENNRVVRIDADGWDIKDYTPTPLFKRYPHQKPSYTPLNQGPRTPQELREGLERILDFLNHDRNDKAARILMLVSIVSCFIEGIPHAALVIHGEHGAGKSTFSEVIKALVDPSKAPIMGFPKGSDNIIQAIDHHWFPVFDNISELKDWQSDIICRAITGAGNQTRKLYSDDDVVIRYYQRCFSLNGISNIVERPDLLDRSVLHQLPRVSDENRVDLKQLWKEFDEEAPLILGTIFDVLSKAISIYPTIKTTGLYRLADWCKWGCAICRAIGVDDNDFLNAYARNRVQQTDEAINASPVASAIYAFMLTKDTWRGIMTELLEDLEKITSSIGISTEAKNWPKGSQALSRKIPHISTSLREVGIEIIDTGRKDKGNRKIWAITKTGIGSSVRSVGKSETPLERYLNESNDTLTDSNDIESNTVHEKRTEMAGEAVLSDSNDMNDINAKELGYIPKSVEEGSIDPRLIPVLEIQNERWEIFRIRVQKLGKTKYWLEQVDLDRMYPDQEERGLIERDLEDWIATGWVIHSLDTKEGPKWRITPE